MKRVLCWLGIHRDVETHPYRTKAVPRCPYTAMRCERCGKPR